MRPQSDGSAHVSASGGLREARKAANRGAILDAGQRVFTEIGFEACTIRDIVRESGLSPGTFYNYFESKEAVLAQLIEELVGDIRERVRAARAAATDSRSFIEDGYRAYFDVFAASETTLQLVARNQNIFRAVVFGGDAGSVSSGVDAALPLQGIFDDLEKDLRGAIRAGYFPRFCVDLASYAMVGAGFELLVRMATRKDITPASAARFLAQLFVGGLPACGEA